MEITFRIPIPQFVHTLFHDYVVNDVQMLTKYQEVQY